MDGDRSFAGSLLCLDKRPGDDDINCCRPLGNFCGVSPIRNVINIIPSSLFSASSSASAKFSSIQTNVLLLDECMLAAENIVHLLILIAASDANSKL